MLTLQSWAKIMTTQNPVGMRNARGAGELAGRLSKAAEGCRRQMKLRELLKMVKVRKPVQVPKAVVDREGKGGRDLRNSRGIGGDETTGRNRE